MPDADDGAAGAASAVEPTPVSSSQSTMASAVRMEDSSTSIELARNSSSFGTPADTSERYDLLLEAGVGEPGGRLECLHVLVFEKVQHIEDALNGVFRHAIEREIGGQ